MSFAFPKRFVAAVALAASVALPSMASAQPSYTEDFNLPGAAWESGWFGQNSDALNYYCPTRGCAERGNAPTALWLAGNGGIRVNFNTAFGSQISQLSLGVGSFAGGNINVWDMSNTLIFSQQLSNNNNYSGGEMFSIASSNGISAFGFDSRSAEGNTNIDDISVNTSTVPEPSSVVLMAAGLAGVVVFGRRRRQA